MFVQVPAYSFLPSGTKTTTWLQSSSFRKTKTLIKSDKRLDAAGPSHEAWRIVLVTMVENVATKSFGLVLIVTAHMVFSGKITLKLLFYFFTALCSFKTWCWVLWVFTCQKLISSHIFVLNIVFMMSGVQRHFSFFAATGEIFTTIIALFYNFFLHIYNSEKMTL